MKRLRHESDHANDQAKFRRIKDEERLRVLRSPDKVEDNGEYRLHYDTSSRSKLSIVAVIAVGTGTAIVSQNPIFGLSAGTLVTIVTYYLQRKKRNS